MCVSVRMRAIGARVAVSHDAHVGFRILQSRYFVYPPCLYVYICVCAGCSVFGGRGNVGVLG